MKCKVRAELDAKSSSRVKIVLPLKSEISIEAKTEPYSHILIVTTSPVRNCKCSHGRRKRAYTTIRKHKEVRKHFDQLLVYWSRRETHKSALRGHFCAPPEVDP